MTGTREDDPLAHLDIDALITKILTPPSAIEAAVAPSRARSAPAADVLVDTLYPPPTWSSD